MSVHNFPGKRRVALRSDPSVTGTIISESGMLPGEVIVQWDEDGDATHISREQLSESAGLHALLICSAILETAKKLQADLDAIKAIAREMQEEIGGK